MWMTVGMLDKNNQGFSYIRISHTLNGSGKAPLTGTTYGNFPVSFIPESAGIHYDNNGNIIMGTANALSSAYWFTNSGFTPKVDDFITKSDGTSYRIIGIDDYSSHDYSRTYYFTLQRDQLAF